MWNTLQRFWLFDDPRSYGARAIVRETAEGLQLVGKTVRLCPLDPASADSALRLREDLLAFRPDAVLLANHPSSLFLRQIGLSSAPCRMFVWLFDDPFLMGSEPFSGEEIVLAADPAFAAGAQRRGARKILFLPVAAPMRKTGEFRAEYAHPALYVGAASNVESMRSQLPPETAAYLDEIVLRKLDDPSAEYEDLLRRFPPAEGKTLVLSGQLGYYLYALSNGISRLRFLKPLVPLGLRLYGNEAWRSPIRGGELEPCFAGSMDPFAEYPHAIVSAQINVNLRSLQGFVVPTQRDFLVPRCGGFLLSTLHTKTKADWRDVDPGNLFALDAFPWSPAADSPEALAEAAAMYLQSAARRREWVDFAAGEIERRHTFGHRMEQLGHLLDAMDPRSTSTGY